MRVGRYFQEEEEDAEYRSETVLRNSVRAALIADFGE
jgi:hypothetical protein